MVQIVGVHLCIFFFKSVATLKIHFQNLNYYGKSNKTAEALDVNNNKLSFTESILCHYIGHVD